MGNEGMGKEERRKENIFNRRAAFSENGKSKIENGKFLTGLDP
jgi:hypothetical protein